MSYFTITTNYYLNENKIAAIKTGTNAMYFSYDAMDKDGNIVVTYLYDAWGNIASVTGTMVSTLGVDNPFRYRGYIYDEETKLYYLQNRYYDPNLCRFISPDDITGASNGLAWITGTIAGILGIASLGVASGIAATITGVVGFSG